jgi:hypothetical protein
MNAISPAVVSAVVQGTSHKKSVPPIPCQDSGLYYCINETTYVMVASDGAGSSKCSDRASSFCTGYVIDKVRDEIDTISTFTESANGDNSTNDDWNTYSLKLFSDTRESLLAMAKADGIAEADLYCTLMLAILTPHGILIAHIGDGRAGGCWNDTVHALFTPFMTFTAGATYFLMKDGWQRFFRSYRYIVPVDQVQYLFLSTDGCQGFVIDNSKPGPKTGPFDAELGDDAFYDGNLAYHPFFEGLIKSLKQCEDDTCRHNRLKRLIEEGIYTLDGNETTLMSLLHPSFDDDKTLLIYYR